MKITSIDITDSVTIEFRKEDGLPQILIQTDGIEVQIGTDKKFDNDKVLKLKKAIDYFYNSLIKE